MIHKIPARIENGHVVPEAPLPEHVRSVSILVETDEADRPRATGRLQKWFGVLKDTRDLEQERGTP